MIAAARRVRPKRSTVQATAGSIRPMAEVSAAKLSSTKNSVENTMPPLIWPNASGSVRNTRSGPASGSSPLANTIGKMIMADNKAMNVSANTTVIEAFGIDVSCGR